MIARRQSSEPDDAPAHLVERFDAFRSNCSNRRRSAGRGLDAPRQHDDVVQTFLKHRHDRGKSTIQPDEEQSVAVGQPNPARLFRSNTISCCGSVAMSASSRAFDLNGETRWLERTREARSPSQLTGFALLLNASGFRYRQAKIQRGAQFPLSQEAGAKGGYHNDCRATSPSTAKPSPNYPAPQVGRAICPELPGSYGSERRSHYGWR
jgi:hypothetical protein